MVFGWTSTFATSVRLIAQLREDLDDLDHDRRVKAGELHEDTRLADPEFPCPMEPCGFSAGSCDRCGKRIGVHPETEWLQSMALALRGGLAPADGDLSFAEWQALGYLRARTEGVSLG